MLPIVASVDRIWPACWARGARVDPPTRRWPARCGCWCSTAGCHCARGCPASASWPRRSACSRTTATAAYAALRDEGFLASRRGSGSWTRLPADPGAAAPRRPVERGRHRPQLRRVRGARGCAARGAGRRLGRAAAPPARPGLRRGRAADAARGDRRSTSPRRGVADHARAGVRHRGRAARVHAAAARARRAGRSRRDRAPDLRGGARRRPRRRRAARPGADAARRLGPRHARGDAAPGRARGSRT